MTKFIQLRNKFSNNILTDSQQKNTKGKGREMSRDVMYDFEPARPAISSTPTISFPSNNPNQGNPKDTPKGPPQFEPGGSMMGPMI